MRIGMLTGGGDVPGLNVSIKTVVREAARRGWTVTGLRRGSWSSDSLDADGRYPL